MNMGENRWKGTKKKTKKKKRKKKDRKGKERKGERGKSASFFPNLRSFNGRNSSDQEVKSVYSTRATLQEVGILPTLVISTLMV